MVYRYGPEKQWTYKIYETQILTFSSSDFDSAVAVYIATFGTGFGQPLAENWATRRGTCAAEPQLDCCLRENQARLR